MLWKSICENKVLKDVQLILVRSQTPYTLKPGLLT